MKRRAVLIEAGEAKGQKKITGPGHDVRRMRTWLTSNVGGAWEDYEIETLHNPSLAEVRAAVRSAGDAEYSVSAFSGHGWIEEDGITGRLTQKIILGTGESVDFGVIRPTSTKSLLICDACREVERITRLSESVNAALRYQRKSADYSRPLYRRAFDEQVRSANPGAFFMYACSVDEYAYEDPLNGVYFTIGLIEQAAEWWRDCDDSDILLVQDAFEQAREIVQVRKPEQSPQGGPENRSGNDFPFAVCIK